MRTTELPARPGHPQRRPGHRSKRHTARSRTSPSMPNPAPARASTITSEVWPGSLECRRWHQSFLLRCRAGHDGHHRRDAGQARTRQPLNGASQTLPKLYDIYNNPTEYAADFHDITSGSNVTYSAAVGYDLVTGLGSPKANSLIFDLAGIAAPLAVTSIDPASGPAAGGTAVTIAGSGFTGTRR